MVSFSRVVLALICVMALAMLPCGQAQNSPQDFLDAHNAARAAVRVRPLVWSNNVAAFAQNYANMRREDCMLTHSGGRLGENLFKGSGLWTARDAVQSWVNERQWYNYNSNSCFPPPSGGSCGHYTQVVWSNSVELGCARVVCNNGEIFITCNYNPPGNFDNQRPF